MYFRASIQEVFLERVRHVAGASEATRERALALIKERKLPERVPGMLEGSTAEPGAAQKTYQSAAGHYVFWGTKDAVAEKKD